MREGGGRSSSSSGRETSQHSSCFGGSSFSFSLPLLSHLFFLLTSPISSLSQRVARKLHSLAHPLASFTQPIFPSSSSSSSYSYSFTPTLINLPTLSQSSSLTSFALSIFSFTSSSAKKTLLPTDLQNQSRETSNLERSDRTSSSFQERNNPPPPYPAL